MDAVIENLSFLLKGAYYTLLITLVSMFFGSILAVIVAIARLKGNRPIRWLARAYVSIIRGTPTLVQIIIVYYGLVDYGIKLEPLMAAYISLSIGIGAYLSETLRGALLSIPKGQTEAAYASGNDTLADDAENYHAASDPHCDTACREYFYWHVKRNIARVGDYRYGIIAVCRFINCPVLCVYAVLSRYCAHVLDNEHRFFLFTRKMGKTSINLCISWGLT